MKRVVPFTEEAMRFMRDHKALLSIPEITQQIQVVQPGLTRSPIRKWIFENCPKTKDDKINICKRAHAKGRYGYGKGVESAAAKRRLPEGTTRIHWCTHNKVPCKFIKIGKGWKKVHILEWVKHNGPIKSNHKIWFKDGDINNCHIDNLYIVNCNSLTNLTDRYIAHILSKGDKELQEVLLEYPAILEYQRNHYLFKRTLKKLRNATEPHIKD